jgi:hypothetical protein
MKKHKAATFALLLIALLGTLLFTACDKREADIASYTISRMTVEPDTIYADNNITYSDVKVYVKDDSGLPVSGLTVKFMCTIGSIEAHVDTDSMGVATATFWDSGEQGLSMITAMIGKSAKTMPCMILPPPEVGEIKLNSITDIMQVGGTQNLTATVLNNLGENTLDGTLVTFQTTQGYFYNLTDGTNIGNREIVSTTNGIATVGYNAGQQKGTAVVTAKVSNVTASRTIALNPASSNFITLTPSVLSVPANSDSSVTISALVQDKYYNPVKAGTMVSFTSTKNDVAFGSITPTATTNEQGVAMAEFSPGIEAGYATVTATADSATASTTLQVTSNEVTYIQFVNTSQVVLQVAGTGGTESAPLTVNLKDGSGNLIDYNLPVFFTFSKNPPLGANINGAVFDTLTAHATAVMAINGVATVPINSGQESGTVSVRAFCYQMTGQTIQATSTSIVINAGAPEAVSLGFGDYNSGDDYGSGYWRVGISATVTDHWGNPVQYGTSVFFSVPDSLEYDWMTVKADAYVGNESVDGDSLAGTAFSYICYDGSHSNDWVTLRVEANNYTAICEMKLPMNQLTLTVAPEWGHVDFEAGAQSPMNGRSRVYVDLYDQLGNYIHDAIINGISDRGLFDLPDTEYQIPNYNYGSATSSNNDNHLVRTNEDGHAELVVLFDDDEVTATDPPPGEQNVQITVYVMGTDITDNCNVLLLDYAD